MRHFDVLCVGGGMVGASLALALAPIGVSIGLLEARDVTASLSQGRVQLPTVALSQGSQQILQALNIWPEIAKEVAPIKQVHVSHQGLFGVARIHARDYGLSALGYVLPGALVLRSFYQALPVHENVQLLMRQRVVDVQLDRSGAYVKLESGEMLHTQLLVAADGTHSPVRDAVGIQYRTQDYGQQAYVFHVQLKRPHAQIAYERFTQDGTVAALPLPGDKVAVVLISEREHLHAFDGYTQREWLAYLQKQFGRRLGEFIAVDKLHSYPLALQLANEQVRQSLVLLGNASHTLSPVAAQGFNLSLRDVAGLAEVLAKAVKQGEPLGELEVLQRYQQQREGDQQTIVRLTHGLAYTLRRIPKPLRGLASLGLLAFDNVPFLQKQLVKHMLGMNGYLTSLGLGVGINEYA